MREDIVQPTAKFFRQKSKEETHPLRMTLMIRRWQIYHNKSVQQWWVYKLDTPINLQIFLFLNSKLALCSKSFLSFLRKNFHFTINFAKILIIFYDYFFFSVKFISNDSLYFKYILNATNSISITQYDY